MPSGPSLLISFSFSTLPPPFRRFPFSSLLIRGILLSPPHPRTFPVPGPFMFPRNPFSPFLFFKPHRRVLLGPLSVPFPDSPFFLRLSVHMALYSVFGLPFASPGLFFQPPFSGRFFLFFLVDTSLRRTKSTSRDFPSISVSRSSTFGRQFLFSLLFPSLFSAFHTFYAPPVPKLTSPFHHPKWRVAFMHWTLNLCSSSSTLFPLCPRHLSVHVTPLCSLVRHHGPSWIFRTWIPSLNLSACSQVINLSFFLFAWLSLIDSEEELWCCMLS